MKNLPFGQWLGLMSVLVTIALFSGCQSGGNSTSAEVGNGASDTGTLKAFASAQAMEDYLKQALASSASTGNTYPVADMIVSITESKSTFTPTNLQESDVDEADRFKSDGRHFFIVGRTPEEASDSLRIRKITGVSAGQPASGAGSTLIGKVALPTGSTYERAYLANQRPDARPDLLLAIGESGQGYFPPGIGIGAPIALARDWFMPWHWLNGKTEMQWVDVSNPESPTLGQRISIDGYLVASRRIGEILYLVTRYTPSIPNLVPYPVDEVQQKENQKQIDAASLADLLPKWSVDGVEQGPVVEASTCYQPVGTTAEATADLIVVSAIDLASPAKAPRSQCLTGSSEAVYVSSKAIYVATARQGYGVSATPVSDNQVVSYPAEATTDIHKFALEAAAPAYRGSGSVLGHLGWEQNKKSFRMGEHDAVLRVFTSLGQDWDGSATTRLTLLREAAGKLEVVSELPNAHRPAAIGKPGERLYAARFVGNRAYLVTFRVTDPLYVLDLSEPTDPFIVGELAIPGYSDYLQPLGERWLIGVGKDAVADSSGSVGDGRGAWYQGVKVALFDVGDPARPKEVNSLVIGKRGTDSAVLHDHHAFTMLTTGNETGELARLAIPIAQHSVPLMVVGDSSDPRTWYDWSQTGLHLFSVTDTGLASHGEIVAESRGEVSYPKVGGSDDRAFMNGLEVHYLHGQEVWAALW